MIYNESAWFFKSPRDANFKKEKFTSHEQFEVV